MAGSSTRFFEAVSATGPSRAETLARLDLLATLLDSAFVVPGTKIRFGLDGLIGLVPGIGDLVTTVISSYIIYEARRLGLPRWKLARMMGNVAFDAVIGIVPFVGDAADILFKANRRNIKILREHFGDEWRPVGPMPSWRAGGQVIDGDYSVVEPRR